MFDVFKGVGIQDHCKSTSLHMQDISCTKSE